MKIYTKRGDRGKTDLFGGQRVLKSCAQVAAYGSVDGANSAVGNAACHLGKEAKERAVLFEIMKDLFDVGAELATASTKSAMAQLDKKLEHRIDDAKVLWAEQLIDEYEAELSPLKDFVLPTGCELASRYHLARTAIRQAERDIVYLMEQGCVVREPILMYINRLSDLFFVMSRKANQDFGIGDVLWHSTP